MADQLKLKEIDGNGEEKVDRGRGVVVGEMPPIGLVGFAIGAPWRLGKIEVFAVFPRARPRWRKASGREADEVRVAQLVVLERRVLDVLADPVAEALVQLELLVALGGHRSLQ